MYAEEYLVEKIQRLEKENDKLKERTERQSTGLNNYQETITLLLNILDSILKESDFTVRDMERNLGVGMLKIGGKRIFFHGNEVCEMLQQAYNNTHEVKPWVEEEKKNG